MKKIILLSIFLYSLVVNAQPVLTREKMAPIGSTYSAAVGAPVSPGSSGANQVWDFSSAILSPAADIKIVDPSSTPYYSMFSSSNYANEVIPLAGGEHFYNYYILSTSQLDKTGGDISSSSGDVYIDFRTDLKFPFTYGFSYTDDFTKSGGGFGSITLTYDGYGTLITPYGTFNDVVRLHKVWDGGEWEYQWWSSENSHVLWSVKVEQTVGSGDVSVGLDNNNRKKEPVVLSPNPATDYCKILGLNESITRIEVLDLSGKTIRIQDSQFSRVDVSALTPGMYFVKIRTLSGQIYTKSITKAAAGF